MRVHIKHDFEGLVRKQLKNFGATKLRRMIKRMNDAQLNKLKTAIENELTSRR